jgi:hypothetical protein
VAGDEPVTAPDQHKPTNVKLIRLGGVAAVLILLAMAYPPQQGYTADIWLLALAGLIAVALVADWVLRRNGLRP